MSVSISLDNLTTMILKHSTQPLLMPVSDGSSTILDIPSLIPKLFDVLFDKVVKLA